MLTQNINLSDRHKGTPLQTDVTNVVPSEPHSGVGFTHVMVFCGSSMLALEMIHCYNCIWYWDFLNMASYGLQVSTYGRAQS